MEELRSTPVARTKFQGPPAVRFAVELAFADACAYATPEPPEPPLPTSATATTASTTMSATTPAITGQSRRASGARGADGVEVDGPVGGATVAEEPDEDADASVERSVEVIIHKKAEHEVSTFRLGRGRKRTVRPEIPPWESVGPGPPRRWALP